ncbi:MAG: hypothetical protein A2X34_09675 [Elusimicrobia bacterium GWC2_51_8]|nr:MAG: hypothetical protein A2X33_10125 [Elusimicrobia bacterium GWA2_51_34]OGR61133.1 MAG: hypothetical protein A2X34_09675 [Elusimicrobia bacterium GWC2_51_8]OGR84719.1 MAG: hypothetical protein A2021_03840 [Elusimicrobia bacterium GWF2_52_66]
MAINIDNYNLVKAPTTHDLVARLFGDRLERQRLSVAEISALISERQNMLQKNIKTLDDQLCTVGGIKSTFNWIHYAPDLATLLKDKLSLEKTVNELDMKKADEYKQCWKDISTLRMELLEGLAEYMSIHNKAEMLAPTYSNPPAQSPAQPLAYALRKLNPYS